MALLCGECVKDSFLRVNPHLLLLKLCYFLVYAVWISVLPYVALISTQIIDYRQLAILFSCIPVISIMSPILTGFLADRMGNYKTLLVASVILAGTIYLPVLSLYDEHIVLKAQLSNNYTDFDNSTVTTSSLVPQHHYTFPALMVIRIAGFVAFDAGNTLMDSSGLTMAHKYGGDFGQQKMWGTFAMVVLPVLCGYLIDVISVYRGFLDYSVAFYMSTVIAIIVIPIIYKLDIEVKKNEHTMLKTAKKVIGMIDVDIFLLAEIFLGFCWGFHMNFISVYILTELGSSKTLFGAALGIGGVGSMIIIWFTKPIISRMGEANTICFGLMLYCIRFITYFFLRSPWVVLLVESVEGLSGFLSIVAGSYYCAAAAPSGMLASLNGILASAVFGAGRGLGTTIGSILIAAYGIRVTYLSFGILAGLAAITYLIVYHTCLKEIEQRRLESKVNTEVIKGVENTGADLNGDLASPSMYENSTQGFGPSPSAVIELEKNGTGNYFIGK